MLNNMPLSLLDISNSLKNAKVCLKIPELAGGHVVEVNGHPVSSSGGYCVVYKFQLANGNYKALRIWHKDLALLPDLPEVASKVSDELERLQSDYFVDYKYYDKAILVAGQFHPAVVMDWCEGQDLKDYISENVGDSSKMLSLANQFKEMVKFFHEKGISHGDLQHGNILVDDNQEIVLVDYDSVYVPTFNGETQITSGMSAYQHPCRKKGQVIATAKDDYFSERIIYLSLLALAEDPSLWNELKDDEGEKDEYSLLLTDKDIENFTNCSLYSTFSKMSNPRIAVLLDEISNALLIGNVNNLVPIEELFINNTDKYDEQPDVTLLDEDDLSFFTKEPVRTYQSAISIKESFDEASAFDRYSQN